MALLECPRAFLQACPELEDLAKLIADTFSEVKVCVRSNSPEVYSLSFEDNTSYFIVSHIHRNESSREYTFDFELISDNKRAWHCKFKGVDVGSLAQTLFRLYSDGFQTENGRFLWSDTACVPNTPAQQFGGERTANTEKDMFPGIEVDCDASLAESEPALILLAKCVTVGVVESKVYIRRDSDRSFSLYFNDNTSYFRIHNPRKSKTGYYGCCIELVVKDRVVWKYANDLVVIWEFQDIIARRYNNGFPQDTKGEHKCWWQVTKCEEFNPDQHFRGVDGDYDSREMVIDCPADIENECRPIKRIASCLGIHLKELNGAVRHSKSKVNYWYVISFDDNTSWFHVRWRGVDNFQRLSFDISLISNGSTIWHKNYRGIEFNDFASEIAECATSGFFYDDNPNETFDWSTTRCDTQEIDAVEPDTECAVPVDNQWVIWDGTASGDVKSFTAIADQVRYCLNENTVNVKSSDDGKHCWLTFANKPQFFKLTDDDTRDPDAHIFTLVLYDNVKIWSCSLDVNDMDEFVSKFADCAYYGFPINDKQRYIWKNVAVCDTVDDEEEAAVEGVVPDGIQQIRVVALKYNGKVIAFRFKTDKGAFDMSKDVASGYGINALKTDKFIALQNINGLLMSESEKTGKRVIPDVSECEADCRRLMNAIFNL